MHTYIHNCFSRHRCGAHCGTIPTKTVSHATLCGAPHPQHFSLGISTYDTLNLGLGIYCTPSAARFARKLFLTPPLRRPLRHDSDQNCFSRHPCGAHCGTIRPKTVSHPPSVFDFEFDFDFYLIAQAPKPKLALCAGKTIATAADPIRG